MANDEDLARIRQGVAVWNDWQAQNRESFVADRKPKTIGDRLVAIEIGRDLSKADLSGADLRAANLEQADLAGVNLSGVDLAWAHLYRARLVKANLEGANLELASLTQADLTRAKLGGAHLSEANLTRANLEGAHLTWADLSDANLTRAKLGGAHLNEAGLYGAILVQTDFTAADLTNCRVYGISAWDLKLDGAIQRDLVITAADRPEPKITVDNLEVAARRWSRRGYASIRNMGAQPRRARRTGFGRCLPRRDIAVDPNRTSVVSEIGGGAEPRSTRRINAILSSNVEAQARRRRRLRRIVSSYHLGHFANARLWDQLAYGDR